MAPSPNSFNPCRQLCQGDVLMQPPGLALIIKWSKTRQKPGFCHLLPLAALPGYPRSPVQAYRAVLQVIKGGHPNDPSSYYQVQAGHCPFALSAKCWQPSCHLLGSLPLATLCIVFGRLEPHSAIIQAWSWIRSNLMETAEVTLSGGTSRLTQLESTRLL